MYRDCSFLRENEYQSVHGQCMKPFVKYAEYIISKYIKEFWKNYPNSEEYIAMEKSIAHIFTLKSDIPTFEDQYEYCLQSLSKVINVSPLALYNDPKLPFRKA